MDSAIYTVHQQSLEFHLLYTNNYFFFMNCKNITALIPFSLLFLVSEKVWVVK